MGKTKAAASRERNEQQLRFVEEYIKDLHGTKAAIRAGYSEKSARIQASQLLAKPNIQEALQKEIAKRSARTHISADRVLKELARIAFSDMRNMISWNEGGVIIKDSLAMTEDDAACIHEISETTTEGGGGSIKIKLHDKMAALTLLTKHLGISSPGDDMDAFEGKSDAEKIEMLEKALAFMKGKQKALPGE